MNLIDCYDRDLWKLSKIPKIAIIDSSTFSGSKNKHTNSKTNQRQTKRAK